MNEEELKNVNEWIKECDVDGRMLNFEFFDTDIEDLKNAVKRDFQKGKDEQKKEELEFLKVFTQRDMHLHIKESDGTPRIVCDYNLILDRIKQLQKEIGGMK